MASLVAAPEHPALALPKAAIILLRRREPLVRFGPEFPLQTTGGNVRSSRKLTLAARQRCDRVSPRADINRCTNRHRTAETFGQILSWLLETVRLRSAPELAVGARAEN